MLKVGDKISTDEIIPAGEKLKYRSNIPRYAQFVFASLDPTFAQRCLENKKKGIVNLIVAGAGYGQGSSREHAALCPMFLGVRLVLAKSFERIHQTNLINAGILPLLFQKEEDEQKIRKGEMIEIKGSREKIKAGKNLVIKTKKGEIEFRYELTSREREIILAGGMLNYLRLIKN
jgi:aconitate hydratase